FPRRMPKRALITGITGQDGSYLAEFLLDKGYEVHGMVRRVALEAPEHRLWRLKHILDRISLHAGSLESYASYSFEDAFSTLDTNINGTLHLLSSIRERSPGTRFYFAATSEMFGLVS